METLNSLPACSADIAKMKILIVDDEPANVALLEAMLRCSGYTQIKTLTDSRVAIATCKTFQPDLVLLDLMMPYVDGFAVLAGIRSEVGDMFLPVIVLTADVNEKTKLRALRASANDFLTKPLDQTEVLVRIGNLLETRKLHLLLDNQRSAFEDAVRSRTAELRTALAELEDVKACFLKHQNSSTEFFSTATR
jgi:putative two-component system response regulator